MKTLFPVLLMIASFVITVPAAVPAKGVKRISLRNTLVNRQTIRYGVLRKNSLRWEDRADVMDELGGSAETEAAAKKALNWLTKNQKEDGHWEETQSKVAHTGLAILCYLSYGVSPSDKSPYGEAVSKALDWLCDQVSESGNMRDGGKMYDQSIGALALGEAYGITGDEKLNLPLRRATDFIIEAQNPKTGGWRYQPHPSLTHAGDLSVSGWVIMALRSANGSGISLNNETLNKSQNFLDSVSAGPNKGKYKYISDKVPNFCMTSVGMFCQQLFGTTSASIRQIESAAYIDLHLPREQQKNYYYWYYGTLTTFLHGGELWNKWNEKMVPIFIKKQNADGSWKPEGNRAKKEGTHVTTCWAALSLMVYYRYLPMIGGRINLQTKPRQAKVKTNGTPRINLNSKTHKQKKK